MAITQQELAQRLRTARKDLEMTQAEVAERLGMHRPTVSEIEAGRRRVTSQELFQFSQVYAIPLSSLVGESAVSMDEVEQILFRKGALAGSDARLSIRRFVERCRTEQDLEQLLGKEDHLPVAPRVAVRPPRSKREAVVQGEEVAEGERARLGLGGEPIRNPVELLDRQGVRVGSLTGIGDAEIDGLYLQTDELGACIGLNTERRDMTGFRRAFTTAHEYAHWVFQDRTLESFTISGSSEDDLLEVRANAFAAAFLMPRRGLRDYFEGMGTLDEGALGALGPADIVRAMDHFGVSRPALLYRLQNVGLLGEIEAERLRALDFSVMKVAGRLGLKFRAEEQVGLRLFALAKQAWRRGLISTGRAADILGVDIVTFRKSMRALGEEQEVDVMESLLGPAE